MLTLYKNKRSNPKGFTLIETLVAITILIIGVLGPLNIATRGIADGYYAKNQITATYLAQEGIEIINNRVFNNAGVVGAGTSEWLDGLDNCLLLGSGPCGVVVDQFTPIFNSCASVDCRLRFDTSINRYDQYDSNNEFQTGPILKREITLTKQNNGSSGADEELKISVRIDWFDKETPRNLVLTNYLYNEIP